MNRLGSPSGDVELLGNSVHLYYANMNVDSETLKYYYSILSKREKELMNLLISEEKQKQYCVRHALLRRLLSGYLGEKPEDILISVTDLGKPFLVVPDVRGEINFSVSSSGSHAVYAVCRTQNIGIDIEEVSEKKDISLLFSKALSLSEQLFLKKQPVEKQVKTFYSFWTRKEALLKAVGTGINRSLDEVEIPVSIELLTEDLEIRLDKKWLFREFLLLENIVGSLAIYSSSNSLIRISAPQLFV